MLFCTYERNNPIDPSADNYVGDESANDRTPPQMVVSIPPVDTSVIDFDSVVVAGAVVDMGMGVDHINVNGFIAFHDSTTPVGNATRVFWHATVYVQQDTTTLTIRAVDRSIHENDTVASKVVVRIRHPRAPSNVGARMVGDDVRVTWRDESLNETAFVIERRAGADAFTAIDTAGANDTAFVDSIGPFQAHTMYAYRVVAINDAGCSEPAVAASVSYDLSATDNEGPAIVFTQPADSATIPDTVVDVYLTVSDPSGVRDGSVKVNGTVAELVGGQWYRAVPLVPGQNTLAAEAIDNSANGNVSNTAIAVFCDTAAADEDGPRIAPDHPTQGETVFSGLIDVIVSVSDVSGVAWVRLDGATMAKGAGTKYSRAGVSLTPGENTLVVTAQDNVGNVDSLELVITRDSSATDTVPPVLTIDYPQSNARFQQDEITVSGSATDNSGIQEVLVDGNAASVSYPDWSASHILSHGHNTIVVQAVDNAGNATDTSVIVLCNRPPKFDSKNDESILLNDQYSVSVFASDADGDSLQFFEIEVPLNVQWQQQADAVFVQSFYPPRDSVYTFVFGVSDGWDSDTVSWTVHASEGNQVPVFTKQPFHATVRVGESYTLQLVADDGNGDTLSFFLVTGPPSMTVSGAGVVMMTPPSADVGSYLVEAGVTDGIDTTFVQWNLEIVENASPQIDLYHHGPPDTAFVDEYYHYRTTVHDPDGDELNLSVGKKPVGMKIDLSYDSTNADYELSVDWQPVRRDTGLHEVNLTVEDNYEGKDNLYWTVEVVSLPGISWQFYRKIHYAPPVTDLAFMPSGGMLVGTAGHSIYFLTDTSMPNIGAGKLPDTISSLAVSDYENVVFVSGKGEDGSAGTWSSRDTLLTWDSTSIAAGTKATAMVTADYYVYALMEGAAQGVYRIYKTGLTWEKFETGLNGTSINALTVDAPAREAFIAVDNGVFSVRKGDSHWTCRWQGSFPIVAMAKQDGGGHLFLGVSNAPLVRLDPSGSDTMMQLPVREVSTVFVSDASPSTVVVAYIDGSTVYSTNAGASWRQTNDNPPGYARCIAEDAAGDIYAGFSNGEIWLLPKP